jgi:hypothetical protein
MLPVADFQNEPPEFWAVVKLVSMVIGYSTRKERRQGGAPSRARSYTADEVVNALRSRDLTPGGNESLVEKVAAYSVARARMMTEVAQPNLMDREEAAVLFAESLERIDAPDTLLSQNKQKGDKRHVAYLTALVNIHTWDELNQHDGDVRFDPDPRGPLTFSANGMPLRTLFRRMDGAYPELNHPIATWEIKEYYGTKTFGSRVADGVYETALDGYELNELRDADVEVKHYLFIDDRFTWWDCGKSYLCRIIDMMHIGLLDAAFVGREVATAWPDTVRTWPIVKSEPLPGEQQTISY